MSGPAAKRLTGAKLGKYTLEDVLGTGGYGQVYLGKPSTGTGRSVAIKVLDALHVRDEDAVERFKRVTDIGSSRGRHYLVMELVSGGSLHKLLRRDHADPDRVLAVLTETARAL